MPWLSGVWGEGCVVDLCSVLEWGVGRAGGHVSGGAEVAHRTKSL